MADYAADAIALLDHLAEHPADHGLVEMMAARRRGAKTEDQLRGEAEQLHARACHDVCDRLDRITCPTLVASGRYDGIAPLPNGDFIASHVPHSELHVYEGGHAFFAQDAKALPEILEFLDLQD